MNTPEFPASDWRSASGGINRPALSGEIVIRELSEEEMRAIEEAADADTKVILMPAPPVAEIELAEEVYEELATRAARENCTVESLVCRLIENDWRGEAESEPAAGRVVAFCAEVISDHVGLRLEAAYGSESSDQCRNTRAAYGSERIPNAEFRSIHLRRPATSKALMKIKLQTVARWVRENGDTLLEVLVFAFAFLRAVGETRSAESGTRKGEGRKG